MWKTLAQTLRGYTWRDRIASIVLLVVFVASVWLGFRSLNPIYTRDTYVEGMVGKVSVLNPLFVDFNDVDRDISALVFSGLMKYDAATGAVVDDVAQMRVNDTKTVYTFVIRPNVFFHDGVALTADDVYFTYHDIIQSPDFPNPFLRANFDGIEIAQKDARTVTFTLPQSNAFFPTNLTLGILPKHVFASVAPGDMLTSELNKNPIGTGSYRVSRPYNVSLKGEGKISLDRFDRYYGGLPHMLHIVFRTFTSADKLFDARSDLHVVARVMPDMLDRFQSDGRFTLTPYAVPQYKAIFFNMDRPIMREHSVRLALVRSVDMTALLGQVPGFRRVDTPLLRIDDPAWGYVYGIKEAMGALFDANWRYSGEKKTGTRVKKDTPLQLSLVYFERADHRPDPDDETTVQFLTRAWSAIGIDVRATLVPLTDRGSIIASRNYDMMLTGERLGYDSDTYSFFHSSQATAQGSNFSQYKNVIVDALIEDLRRSNDPDHATARLMQLAKALREDIPALFLFRPTYYFASNGRVQGYALDHLAYTADRFFNIQSWNLLP